MVVGTTQTFNFELQIIDKIGGNRPLVFCLDVKCFDK